MEAGQRYGIIEAVIHLVNRDFVALADLYKRLGFIPQDQVLYCCTAAQVRTYRKPRRRSPSAVGSVVD